VTEQSAQGFFIWACGVSPTSNNQFIATEAIMEIENLEIVRLELKYCERCGGLWMRTKGTEDVYCPACAVEVLDLPTGGRRRKLRLLADDRIDLKSQGEDWSAVCGEGGNA
jgi:hypothetical protein